MTAYAGTSATRTAVPLAEILRAGRNRLRETPALLWLGVTGIALGIFCLAVAAARQGVPIGIEGDLTKPGSFNVAVGIYVLTLAMVFPSARFSERGRKRWLRWSVALGTYSFAIETIQTFRGLDPRFTRVGSPADQIAGGIFGLVSIGLVVLFVVMALKFFGQRPDARSAIILAIRYGCAAALAAFAAGIWMSAIQGRHTGVAGNILPLHALGFHGLQAIPIVALLLVWSGADNDGARKWVHITGIAWLAACAAVAWQTFMGRAVYETSPATLAGAFLLVVWAGIVALAFWRWARLPARPHGSPDTSRTPI
jgi:hypothetical protein